MSRRSPQIFRNLGLFVGEPLALGPMTHPSPYPSLAAFPSFLARRAGLGSQHCTRGRGIPESDVARFETTCSAVCFCFTQAEDGVRGSFAPSHALFSSGGGGLLLGTGTDVVFQSSHGTGKYKCIPLRPESLPNDNPHSRRHSRASNHSPGPSWPALCPSPLPPKPARHMAMLPAMCQQCSSRRPEDRETVSATM